MAMQPTSQQQVLATQRMQLDHHYTQGIPAESASGSQRAH
jgi:hypothetical protein